MGMYIKFLDKFHESKFTRLYNIEGQKYCYIHFTILKEVLEWLMENWYEILWYDGMIVNERWVEWPLSLIFDFSRKNYSVIERNKLALKNVDVLIKQTKEGWYDLNDLFVDLIIRNENRK